MEVENQMDRKREDTIVFTEDHRRYGAFCLGAPYVIRIDDVSWPTDRHYLLGMKYPGVNPLRLRQTASYAEAVKLVQTEGAVERVKWDVVRDDYLERVLRAKFSQHLDLEALLRSTGDHPLVYGNADDSYYGVGASGAGHNMFGRILMRVRGRVDRSVPERHNAVIEGCEEWVRRNPDDMSGFLRLTIVYLANRMPERASATAYRAIHLDPQDPRARIALAYALVDQHRFGEALEHLRFVNRRGEADEDDLRLLATVYRALGRDVAADVLESRARRLEAEEEDDCDGDDF